MSSFSASFKSWTRCGENHRSAVPVAQMSVHVAAMMREYPRVGREDRVSASCANPRAAEVVTCGAANLYKEKEAANGCKTNPGWLSFRNPLPHRERRGAGHRVLQAGVWRDRAHAL